MTKKSILAGVAVAAGMALAMVSCGLFENQSTPAGFVRHCVRLLDKQALYADTPEWQQTRKEILAEAKTLSGMDEARDAVSRAAAVAGGKHSRLAAPVVDTTRYKEEVPEVKMLEDKIIRIVLPAHSGIKVSDSLYLHTVLDFLQAAPDARGVILDLRDNAGGNMYPMIAAVSPLIPDGIILRFKSRKRTTPIPLDYVVRSAGLDPASIGKFPISTPVAILTNEWTGSSGEATLLCFRGLENAKTFGAPTAGYASANNVVELAGGYKLLITTSCDVARTGEVFCDDPIGPDVTTDTPEEDALRWIGTQTSVPAN